MTAKWIRNISLGAFATLACLVGTNSVHADGFNRGHNRGYSGYNRGYSTPSGYPYYAYRPIIIQPYYGTNFGVGGYSNNFGYSNNYGGYSSNYGGFNNFGGGYGVGGYPTGSSYGGGAFPRGGSYGGGNGAFPRGGSYGGGFSGR